MTDRDSFLRAIIENPQDDALRLIFADWLDEHGDSGRTEFIRVQVELEKFSEDHEKTWQLYGMGIDLSKPWFKEPEGWTPELQKSADRFLELKKREQELLDQAGRLTWFSELGVPWPDVLPIFRRGFVAEITCTCADFIQHREALLRVTPLERVTLTQVVFGDFGPDFTEEGPRTAFVYPDAESRSYALPSPEDLVVRPGSLPLEVRNGQLILTEGTIFGYSNLRIIPVSEFSPEWRRYFRSFLSRQPASGSLPAIILPTA